ncbi:MAG: PAS domain-containing protein [Desulfovermiculus sp.]|nr:PAS domain-containing protein [Desulfovermiculus sp.]
MDFNLISYHPDDLFDAVTDLMAALDLELRIQWANRAAGESVGEAPESLLGRYCYQVWLGRDTPCEQCPVQSTIRTDMQHKGEVESPDGKVFLIKSYPMRTPEEELKGIAEVALDITEYRRAEESLCRQSEEQALLLESVPTQYLVSYGCGDLWSGESGPQTNLSRSQHRVYAVPPRGHGPGQLDQAGGYGLERGQEKREQDPAVRGR